MSTSNGVNARGYPILFIIILFSIYILAFITIYTLYQCNWDEKITIILLFCCSTCSCGWTLFVPDYALTLITIYIYY